MVLNLRNPKPHSLTFLHFSYSLVTLRKQAYSGKILCGCISGKSFALVIVRNVRLQKLPQVHYRPNPEPKSSTLPNDTNLSSLLLTRYPNEVR
ncbi:unnamed protein product [Brugia pahangi]|uniref:Ovule protein n=1 Tax=Brugia pahangi TaxID=6280 RepID=A0A0N4TII7_BRUPA|nr:unnamed protein product [Brugia pahangi]